MNSAIFLLGSFEGKIWTGTVAIAYLTRLLPEPSFTVDRGAGCFDCCFSLLYTGFVLF